MNYESPDKSGEFEVIDFARLHHKFCANDEIMEIQCRRKDGKEEVESGICDKVVANSGGYICLNENQVDNVTCSDHEIRVACPCVTTTPGRETFLILFSLHRLAQ
jgi:hypothetical protein